MTSTAPGPVSETSTPLNVENILWANTVLAAGSAIGVIVYTGKETRAVMNTGEPTGQKMGRIEAEVNKIAKVYSASRYFLGLIPGLMERADII